MDVEQFGPSGIPMIITVRYQALIHLCLLSELTSLEPLLPTSFTPRFSSLITLNSRVSRLHSNEHNGDRNIYDD